MSPRKRKHVETNPFTEPWRVVLLLISPPFAAVLSGFWSQAVGIM